MCTVTYIPTKDQGFALTSNRDERAARPTKAPKIYNVNNIDMAFPKDMEKGGTWIAAGNNGRLVCLLNGAFVSHQKQDFHTHSRGVVLLDMAAFKGNTKDFFENEPLQNTEPFTIISIEKKNEKVTGIQEFIWDGAQKHISKLAVEKPYIWSSSTLYTDKDRVLRKKWFNDFLKENQPSISSGKAYAFHSGSHILDQSINLLMEREGGLKTVSITQVVPSKEGFTMKYVDLVNEKLHLTKV